MTFIRLNDTLLKTSDANWNTEYSRGDWDFLASTNEAMHYAVLTSLTGVLGKNDSLLDVCCGEGILLKHLRKWGYTRYLGIDFSSEAIAKASKLKDCNTHFMLTDANDFHGDQLFTSIYLCECLYYLHDPLAILKKYSEMLTQDGVIVASVFVDNDLVQEWMKQIEQRLTMNHSILISNLSGKWKCMALDRLSLSRLEVHA